jgi:hypothetical protein
MIGGFVGWLAATLALRFTGQYVLHPGNWRATLGLFAVSFLLMAWLARTVCAAIRLPDERWQAGAISLLLPTLLLDPFSSAFFSHVFPNINPTAAGLFGGWMLWCCASALVGVSFRLPAKA